jgi:hypothetical protein
MQPSLYDCMAKRQQANPYNEANTGPLQFGPLPPLPPLHVSTFCPFSTSGGVTGRFFDRNRGFLAYSWASVHVYR